MRKKTVIDDVLIKKMAEEIAKGKSVTSVCKINNISRETYYKRVKNNCFQSELPKHIMTVKDLKDILEVDSTSTLYALLDEKKSKRNNQDAMLYLYKTNYEKYKNQMYIMVCKHFDISLEKLILILQNTK